ncbi:MAG: quinoprotein dehydrogenase-associated SoxYZ-like carrier [Sterolibacteriaceae bacterium]|nr:quinoprotein dehydrogenase-associated SoxYZ-like carrier [Candidatus Methylophosphatis haderslevensis]
MKNGRIAVIARVSLAGLTLVLGLAGSAAAQDKPTANNWEMIRQSLFAGRTIDENAAAVLELDTPTRAEDAAVVPIAIRTKLPHTASSYVRKVYLVVDHNPSPLGAVFTFTPESGRADIETRIRIEEYTNVRAIAEMSDGRLFMTTNYVKASGGCSAPAGKDLEESMARLGKMKFRLESDVKPGEATLAQLMISHPNLSGLAMDQVTRLFTPAHFVRKIDVTYGGKPVMSAEVDFTISENPNVRFYFVPSGPGELKAEVVDSNQLKFESSIQVRPGKTAGS